MTKTTDILQVHSRSLEDYTVQQTDTHINIPVVMMVEGVHNGSLGALYHSSSELKKSAKLWRGQSVVINHPQDSSGNYISANTEGVVSIGTVTRAWMDGSKLKGIANIDVQKLAAVSPETLQLLQGADPIEVSIGVFSEEIAVDGVWNGEEYKAIAINHVPDHLAILPHDVGACSWQDGCGVRVNKESINNKNSMPMENLSKVLKDLHTNGYAVSLIANATGFHEILNKVSNKVDSMDNDMRSHYVEEVFDDAVVYRVRSQNGGGMSRMYKQGYSIGADGEVEFIGEPSEVRRQVDYIPLQRNKGKDATNKQIINNEKQGGKNMSDASKSPCLTAKVDGLIANKATKFAESDRDWLLAQSEEVLNKLEPSPAPPVVVNTGEKEVTREDALKVLNLNKLEDFTAIMPDAVKAEVESGIALRTQRREGLIKSIIANSAKETWTEDELKGFSCNQLEKINKSIGAAEIMDFSGLGAGSDQQVEMQANTDNSADGIEPLVPAGV